MPKIYQIMAILRPAHETGPEQLWTALVLARSEHGARRKILESALCQGMLVSYFQQVERCK